MSGPWDFPPAPRAHVPHFRDRTWVPWVVITVAVAVGFGSAIWLTLLLPGP